MNTPCTKGLVLYSTHGFNKRNWVVESVSKSFAIMTELKWSEDMVKELGCCRRKEVGPTIRRKIQKDGLPYCKTLGSFHLRNDIRVLDN